MRRKGEFECFFFEANLTVETLKDNYPIVECYSADFIQIPKLIEKCYNTASDIRLYEYGTVI